MTEINMVIKYVKGDMAIKKIKIPTYKLTGNAMRGVIEYLLMEEDEDLLTGAISIQLLQNIEDDKTMSFPLIAE